MNNYTKSKYKKRTASIMKPCETETKCVPNEFCKYMDSICSRFNEICKIYLKGLSIDDIKYLQPNDLICLVPPENYEHKLLMTIMAKRYLFRNDDCCCSSSNDDM